MNDRIHELVARGYPRIATEVLAPLLRLLQLAREHCEGDLDKFLLLLAIGVRMRRHRALASYTTEELANGEFGALPGFGTNVRSVADSLGLPRETVRRKVQDMLETGWLIRQDRRLHMTSKCYRELGPLRVEVEQMVVTYHKLVVKLNSTENMNCEPSGPDP